MYVVKSDDGMHFDTYGPFTLDEAEACKVRLLELLDEVKDQMAVANVEMTVTVCYAELVAGKWIAQGPVNKPVKKARKKKAAPE